MNNQEYLFKIGNKIRNTGRTRFKKGIYQGYGFKKGHMAWNKGTKGIVKAWNKGLNKLIKECRQCKNSFELSGWEKNQQYCSRKCYINNVFKNTCSLNQKLRKSKAWVIWRTAVFKRDKYICQKCEIKSGLGFSVELHPHHEIPLSKLLQTEQLSLIFNVDNGITLCKSCHMNLHKGENHGID